MRPEVACFFDDRTNSASYVVSDPQTARAAIVDPVLEFDPVSGRTWTESADRLIAHVREKGLTIDWLLETHVHADHLTASPYIAAALGGITAIGRGIVEVQETFGALFNTLKDMPADGSQFGRLFDDGDAFAIGKLEARASRPHAGLRYLCDR